jgi:hypothetical protein
MEQLTVHRRLFHNACQQCVTQVTRWIQTPKRTFSHAWKFELRRESTYWSCRDCNKGLVHEHGLSCSFAYKSVDGWSMPMPTRMPDHLPVEINGNLCLELAHGVLDHLVAPCETSLDPLAPVGGSGHWWVLPVSASG